MGGYISQDPIKLNGGFALYSYVKCSNSQLDLLGLVELGTGGFSVYGLYKPGAIEPYYIGITNQGVDVRAGQHADDGRFRAGDSHVEFKSDLKIEEARGWEQALIETKGTKTSTIGESFRNPDGTLKNVDTGNKVASFDHNRIDDRGIAFQTEYEKAMKEMNNEKNIISCSQ